ncbi:MAG TPA: DUF2520 domain-containing protein [Thiolinea sp.]|nr:DUF2520 domain-containing protein [Thiolinea sp.]
MVLLTLNLIGCGRTGQVLGRLFFNHNQLKPGAVLNRSLDSGRRATSFMGAATAVETISAMPVADLWLLGCPDHQIASCAAGLAQSGQLRPGQIVFHCSGALGSDALAVLRSSGAWLASVHPVRSFARPQQALDSFPGTACGMEGDEAALVILEPLFQAIGGQPFRIEARHKLLYHAGSVMACNYLVVLMETSLQLLAQAGVERAQALALLQPLVTGTVANVFANDTSTALSGPIARADHALVARQWQAVADWQPEAGELYRLLGQEAVNLAARTGQNDAERMADLRQIRALFAGKTA